MRGTAESGRERGRHVRGLRYGSSLVIDGERRARGRADEPKGKAEEERKTRVCEFYTLPVPPPVTIHA